MEKRSMFDLSGQVAVVTGASQGLGATFAKAYAEYGADVALLARNEAKLQKVAEEVRAYGRRALVVACDVTSEESIKNAVEKVLAEFGKVDILCNNAGIAKWGCVHSMELEEWNQVMNTNLTGTMLMCKYVLPGMMERRYGRIVNISSINAWMMIKSERASRPAYNASKAGLNGLTNSIAATYGKYNITANAIGPCWMKTDMTEQIYADERFMHEFVYKRGPMNRAGEEDELNSTLIYLSSPASGYITGQFIVGDGGFGLV